MEQTYRALELGMYTRRREKTKKKKRTRMREDNKHNKDEKSGKWK